MARPATGQVVERTEAGPDVRAALPRLRGAPVCDARPRRPTDGHDRGPSRNWPTRSPWYARASGDRRHPNRPRSCTTTQRSTCSRPSGWRRSGTKGSENALSPTTSGRSPITCCRSSPGTGCRRSPSARSTGTRRRRHESVPHSTPGRSAGEKRVPLGLSANTTNKTLVRLAQILEVAVEYGMLPGNPARGRRRRLKSTRPRRGFVQPEQLMALLEASESYLHGRGRPLLATLAGTGVRIQEASTSSAAT